MLNGSGQKGHLFLVLYLKEKCSVPYMMLSVGFSWVPFISFEKSPSLPSLSFVFVFLGGLFILHESLLDFCQMHFLCPLR